MIRNVLEAIGLLICRAVAGYVMVLGLGIVCLYLIGSY